jgi:hypothetical protein
VVRTLALKCDWHKAQESLLSAESEHSTLAGVNPVHSSPSSSPSSSNQHFVFQSFFANQLNLKMAFSFGAAAQDTVAVESRKKVSVAYILMYNLTNLMHFFSCRLKN